MVWFLPLEVGAQGTCPTLPEQEQMKYGDVASGSELHCLHLPCVGLPAGPGWKMLCTSGLFQSQQDDNRPVFKMHGSLSPASDTQSLAHL